MNIDSISQILSASMSLCVEAVIKNYCWVPGYANLTMGSRHPVLVLVWITKSGTELNWNGGSPADGSLGSEMFEPKFRS